MPGKRKRSSTPVTSGKRGGEAPSSPKGSPKGMQRKGSGILRASSGLEEAMEMLGGGSRMKTSKAPTSATPRKKSSLLLGSMVKQTPPPKARKVSKTSGTKRSDKDAASTPRGVPKQTPRPSLKKAKVVVKSPKSSPTPSSGPSGATSPKSPKKSPQKGVKGPPKPALRKSGGAAAAPAAAAAAAIAPQGRKSVAFSDTKAVPKVFKPGNPVNVWGEDDFDWEAADKKAEADVLAARKRNQAVQSPKKPGRGSGGKQAFSIFGVPARVDTEDLSREELIYELQARGEPTGGTKEGLRVRLEKILKSEQAAPKVAKRGQSKKSAAAAAAAPAAKKTPLDRSLLNIDFSDFSFSKAQDAISDSDDGPAPPKKKRRKVSAGRHSPRKPRHSFP